MASTATNTDAQADAKFDDYTAIFSATDSTSGVQTIQVERGYLTELIVRIDGDLAAGSLTGGPVKIEAYIKRQMMIRHLCRGAIQNEMQVKGSGQIWIPSRSDIVIKWTNLSATAVVVRVSPIVSKQAQGDSAPGWMDETIRPIGYMYQARRVNTQTNAAGGALYTNITMPAGVSGQLITWMNVNSANNGLFLFLRDEDAANTANLGFAGAAAGLSLHIPSVGGNAAASNNNMNTVGLRIPPAATLTCYQSAAGAQNDTMTTAIILLMSDAQAPTWTTTGSAGTPSLANSTISDANTWQAVYGA